MPRNNVDEEEHNNMTPASSSTRLRSIGPDPFLVVCRCFSFLTALIAILCLAVNVLSAYLSFKNGSDVFNGIFRCYVVVLAFFVVLAETEWGFIIKFWKDNNGQQFLVQFLNSFSSVAVMTRAFPDYSERQDLVLLQNIASYMLLACGAVYLIMGILCIGFLKRQQKEISREHAIKDLEELERRREELEHLLVEERVR